MVDNVVPTLAPPSRAPGRTDHAERNSRQSAPSTQDKRSALQLDSPQMRHRLRERVSDSSTWNTFLHGRSSGLLGIS